MAAEIVKAGFAYPAVAVLRGISLYQSSVAAISHDLRPAKFAVVVIVIWIRA
jgi:hypothetical protein